MQADVYYSQSAGRLTLSGTLARQASRLMCASAANTQTSTVRTDDNTTINDRYWLHRDLRPLPNSPQRALLSCHWICQREPLRLTKRRQSASSASTYRHSQTVCATTFVHLSRASLIRLPSSADDVVRTNSHATYMVDSHKQRSF
jgi:hypothetical protein